MANLQRCSFCEQRPPEKLSQLTWAWLRADHVRTAWRQKLCPTCFAANLLALDQPVDASERLRCPACGIDTEDDMDPVYVTAYVPGQGKFRWDLPLCGACAARIRVRAQKNAQFLEDRESESRGQAPSTTPSGQDVWASLGLDPARGPRGAA